MASKKNTRSFDSDRATLAILCIAYGGYLGYLYGKSHGKSEAQKDSESLRTRASIRRLESKVFPEDTPLGPMPVTIVGGIQHATD